MNQEFLPPTSYSLQIPASGGSETRVDLQVGQVLFVLGANGVGKSSLMQRFFSAHRLHARRISAHRQTWFSSGVISMSGEERRNAAANIRNWDSNPAARWKEDGAAERAVMSIYDLVDAQNVRARKIADAMDAQDVELAKQLSKADSPLKAMNELLRQSNIPVEILVQSNETVVARKSGGPPYSVAELSDGERNVLLIASNVLTAERGSLMLIDEPERHLHRSIIAPLLTLLFATRSDCAFVVSTHDVMLASDNDVARVALIRSCKHGDGGAIAWDVDLLSSPLTLEDQLLKDILGARRRILFVEGTESSLDVSLYSLVFPGVSVVPKASCRDVEQAVSGIREAENLHWVRAFGIVDRDHRRPEDVAKLQAKGVYALAGC